jgi:O-methyltransferase involved in polyketide biosynthesis
MAMTGTDREPEGVDTTLPSAARVYDWYLGGEHHWAADREFGAKAVEIWPAVPVVARHNRRWLGRVVRNALDAGIRQFLDLGSGLPTAGNIHDVVEQHAPGTDARVVYTDFEPVALAHSREILAERGVDDRCGVASADIRRPREVLTHPEVKRLLDLSEPVCVLMVAVLHFVGEEAWQVLSEYHDQFAEGSWLALSHISDELAGPDEKQAVERFRASYDGTTSPLCVRNRAEIESWFPDGSLLPPGIVPIPDWRPDSPRTAEDDTARRFAWCGVGEIREE